ncbi:TetR/AcrR family transcriptional regulator [Crossiella sp. CA198]|uniref:TetR/AcrR family transcriptional regulator n=1 Tax=Crossiella sp. CA198 TaxID=3455607 RepID=UPI003F8D55F4
MPRPRSFDEREVLTAVCAQFERAGYAATSLDDLMQVTGLGKGSLYGAFGDKRQLFLRALEINRERQVEALCAGLREGSGSMLERLRALLVRMATTPSTQERFGCLLVSGATELGGDDPEVLARTQSTFAAIEELVARALATAVTEGELHPDTDTSAQARVLLATLQGVELLRRGGLSEQTIGEVVGAAVTNLPGPATPAPVAG